MKSPKWKFAKQRKIETWLCNFSSTQVVACFLSAWELGLADILSMINVAKVNAAPFSSSSSLVLSCSVITASIQNIHMTPMFLWRTSAREFLVPFTPPSWVAFFQGISKDFSLSIVCFIRMYLNCRGNLWTGENLVLLPASDLWNSQLAVLWSVQSRCSTPHSWHTQQSQSFQPEETNRISSLSEFMHFCVHIMAFAVSPCFWVWEWFSRVQRALLMVYTEGRQGSEK